MYLPFNISFALYAIFRFLKFIAKNYGIVFFINNTLVWPKLVILKCCLRRQCNRVYTMTKYVSLCLRLALQKHSYEWCPFTVLSLLHQKFSISQNVRHSVAPLYNAIHDVAGVILLICTKGLYRKKQHLYIMAFVCYTCETDFLLYFDRYKSQKKIHKID